jgi:hypothetical protein
MPNAALDSGDAHLFDGGPNTRATEREMLMGMLRVLDHTGDTVVAWDLDDDASLVAAEAEFEHQLKRRHRVPFARRCGEAANRAKPIIAFDPTVEEIVFAAPVMGG